MLSHGIIREIGYTVAKLNRAVEFWTSTFNVGPFHHIARVPYLYVRSDGHDIELNLSAAIAESGTLSIALVCPLDDTPSLYRQPLSNPFATFHHWTVETPDLEADVERYTRSGIIVACEGAVDGRDGPISFAYIDLRAESGGYLELIEARNKRV